MRSMSLFIMASFPYDIGLPAQNMPAFLAHLIRPAINQSLLTLPWQPPSGGVRKDPPPIGYKKGHDVWSQKSDLKPAGLGSPQPHTCTWKGGGGDATTHMTGTEQVVSA